MKKSNTKAVKQVEKLLGVNSLTGRTVYLINHTHKYGNDTYIFSTAEKRSKAMKKLQKEHEDDLNGETDFLEEDTSVIDDC